MCHVGLSLVAKKQTTNTIVLVLPVACMACANMLFATALIMSNFLFQMGMILGHLSRQPNVVNLKVPEVLATGKSKGHACVCQGGLINLMFNVCLV